jgi:hypothetical protein
MQWGENNPLVRVEKKYNYRKQIYISVSENKRKEGGIDTDSDHSSNLCHMWSNKINRIKESLIMSFVSRR